MINRTTIEKKQAREEKNIIGKIIRKNRVFQTAFPPSKGMVPAKLMAYENARHVYEQTPLQKMVIKMITMTIASRKRRMISSNKKRKA